MPNQMVITSTLKDIKALDTNGEQTPETMVIRWSVLALSGNGDVTVLIDYDNGRTSIEVVRGEECRWLEKSKRNLTNARGDE